MPWMYIVSLCLHQSRKLIEELKVGAIEIQITILSRELILNTMLHYFSQNIRLRFAQSSKGYRLSSSASVGYFFNPLKLESENYLGWTPTNRR